MYWAPFFHIYQPPDQSFQVLERIVNESYRPLIKKWRENPRTRLTLNINACLTEMLVKNGFKDVVEGLADLVRENKLEFTESAKYHAFLPILPKTEIKRQIELNHKTNRKYFGPTYAPVGFFPPEMGYSRRVGEVVQSMGYKWILIDEIAYNGKIENVDFGKSYFLSDSHGRSKKSSSSPLIFFFRERKTSNLIMSATVRTKESLWTALEAENKQDRYLITAMDGETFGHHRLGLDEFLDEIYQDENYTFYKISDLLNFIKKTSEKTDPLSCTWATSEEEISSGKNFYLYYNSKNKLHILQKKLIDLAINTISRNQSRVPRHFLDRALSCNHMWWSNPDAWWSIEEIERGAYALRESLKKTGGYPKACIFYQKIMSQAFEWQRLGLPKKLHEEKEKFKKIPFKNRAKPGEYEAILTILREEENKAVKNREYELALRWRDSLVKLEKGFDIYDYLHIVDQMRIEGRLKEYEGLAKKYRGEYNKISPGQPDK